MSSSNAGRPRRDTEKPCAAGPSWARRRPRWENCNTGRNTSLTRDRNLPALRLGLRGFKLWPYDRAAAEEYGRIAAYLHRVGRKIQQVDMQLAAVALLLPDCTLVTADTDFAAIPGLRTENWAV